jgi:hypothetical protein
VYSPLIGKSILRRIHLMKELTEVTLTDLWREYNQSFRDFWEIAGYGGEGIQEAIYRGIA